MQPRRQAVARSLHADAAHVAADKECFDAWCDQHQSQVEISEIRCNCYTADV
jgi:hypothetical protein